MTGNKGDKIIFLICDQYSRQQQGGNQNSLEVCSKHVSMFKQVQVTFVREGLKENQTFLGSGVYFGQIQE